MDNATDTPDDAEGVALSTDTGAPFLLAESPSHLLHRAQQFAAELFASLYDKHVTLRQFAVLAAVQGQAGATQTDLVNATGIDRSTLAEMIARLEDKGLVAREKSNSDGRAKSVRLTGRGRARLAEATPHAIAADLAILEALPKPKRRALLDILQALNPAIDAARAARDTGAGGKKGRKKRNKKDKPTKSADGPGATAKPDKTKGAGKRPTAAETVTAKPPKTKTRAKTKS